MVETLSGSNIHLVKTTSSQDMKSNDVNNRSKISTMRKAAAVSSGALVGLSGSALVGYDTFKKVTPQMATDLAYSMQYLLPNVETVEQTNKNISKLLKDTGLKDKGVKFLSISADGSNSQKLKEIIDANVKPTNWLMKRLNASSFNIYSKGGNAAFAPETNHILVHENLCSTAYHELGHALNANGNILTKGLQKARCLTPAGMSIVAPLVLAVGLFHNVDKTKPNSEKGFKEKTADFIKNHAAALTLASYVPMVGEEALASVRGVRQASKVASKDVVKGLTKNYAKAWGTYALVAGLVSGAVALGIAISDKIKQKKSA